jgi:peptidoglycan/xylan/chitin deacetylase (PgdA/CDA1 family)
MDLEVADDHDPVEQEDVLDRLDTDLRAIGIAATVFVTGEAAKRFDKQLRRLASAHEVGCHGLTHDKGEDFRSMTGIEAESRIASAGEAIANVTGVPPRAFRGPAMTTSAETQAALIRLGYYADLSVCARRYDVLTSRSFTPGWITAPTAPYRPSSTSPFRRGDERIAVIPLSGAGLPFVSGVLHLFGPRFMRGFYRALHAEASRRELPIVYLFHSYELTQIRRTDEKPMHQRLYRHGARKRYDVQLDFLRYLLSAGPVEPMTAGTLVNRRFAELAR